MVLEEVLGKQLVNEVVGIVLVHLDFFQNHAALAGDLAGREHRIQHHVAQDVDGHRQVLVEHLHVEAHGFLAGEGVHVAANGIHLPGDVFRAAAGGSLEHHVLDEMRDAVDRRLFVTRAGLHPDAQRHRANVVHLLGDDGETVGQHLTLDVAKFFYHCGSK